ncbi:hypothetical protein ACWGDT_15775 [Streptomyces avermitilis]
MNIRADFVRPEDPFGGSRACSSKSAAAPTRAAAGDEVRTAAARREPRTLITFDQK